jgi:acyl-coenzyme A synthetase/AMP-(fatty) acid ligase
MLSVFDKGPAAPCPDPFNLAAYVLGAARRTPDKTALSVVSEHGHADWSYGALEAAVLGVATGLLARGLAPGDRVLMRVGNTVEFPITYLACIAVGLVPVPTSPMLTAPEVARMVDQLSPRAIVHAPEVPVPDFDGTLVTVAELERFHDLPPAPYQMGNPDRLAYIIYTSGTSGTPRAVMHAHRAIWARRMMHRGWYDLVPDDRVLHAGAFNWTFTLGTGLMDPWSVGATSLIPVPGTPPELLPEILHAHDATLFAAAPGVYRKMLKRPGAFALPALRHGLAAGEKLPEALRVDWAARTGTQIHEAFGMSECSTFISGAPNAPALPDTLGRPQAGRHIAILDGAAPVARGAEGVIAVHRTDPGLMLGYFGAEEDTAARFRGDWFVTGDRGVMSEDDSITYMGRDDDMMNAGGFRVSPVEVEKVLITHPDIQQIGVTDVEIKRDTRVIAAFYTSDHPLDAAQLADFAKERLARYKQPRMYRHLETLPTNPNGKLSRRALRAFIEAPNDD